MGERRLDPRGAVVELGGVARKFLSEGERSGVLEVGASDLDHRAEGLRAFGERRAERPDRGKHPFLEGQDRRHVHRGREHVVRRLAPVHVVVRVDEALFAARPAEDFAGPVREHLVQVHVGLGAAAGLPDEERELALVFSREDLVGGGRDGVRLLLGEPAEIPVHQRRRLLDERERRDDFAGHPFTGDAEVLAGTLGLRPVEPLGGNGHLAEGVPLDSGL